MKRIILAVVLAAALLAGCGGGHPVAYRPIAYGENNQCYFVNSPAEVVALQAQGLCQPGWAPTLMPLSWHLQYAPYFASPAYYNVYIPVGSRSSYAASEKSWGANNKTAIATASKSAKYQGSNGKTVSADKIGATKYGGGGRFGPAGTKFSGGSGRAGGAPSKSAPAAGTPSKTPASPSKPAATPAPKSSPGVKSSPAPRSSGGSKSYGGGSGRSSGGGYGGGGGRSYGGGGRR